MDFIFKLIIYLSFFIAFISILFSLFLFYNIRKRSIRNFEKNMNEKKENFNNLKVVQIKPDNFFSNKIELDDFILKVKFQKEHSLLNEKEAEFYKDFIVKLKKYNFN